MASKIEKVLRIIELHFGKVSDPKQLNCNRCMDYGFGCNGFDLSPSEIIGCMMSQAKYTTLFVLG